MSRRAPYLALVARMSPEQAQMVVAPLLAGVMVSLTAFFRDQFLSTDIETASRFAVSAAVVSYAVVLTRADRGPWSLGPMVLLLLILFHFGDLVVLAAGLSFSPADRDYVNLWLFGPLAVEAVYLSTLAATAFAFTYVLLNPGRAALQAAPDNETEENRGVAFATLGAVLVIGGVGLYFARALTAAPGVLFSSNYLAYNQLIGGDRIVSYASLSIVVGLVLAAAAPKSPRRTAALVAFGLYAVVLLPLGVRTAVLFPAAAAAVAMARRHRMPSGVKALAVVLAGLALIGVVREVREPGGELNVSDVAPTSALVEMGGTLRPVIETLGWRVGYKEPPYRGVTYAAPVMRLAERALGWETPEPDPRLPGTLMRQRVEGGQFGYSAVAEAYLNFSTLGVGLIFAMFGAVSAGLDRVRRGGLLPAALAGVAMAGIGLTMRNSFISLPSTIISGTVAVWVAAVLARRKMR
jgi:hypothetical protein